MPSTQTLTRLQLPTALAATLLLLPGCGLKGGSDSSAVFKLVASSIATNNQVKQNQDLTFTFNFAANEASVTSETLQVLEVDPSGGGGSEPLGSRTVNGKVVSFRPAVSIDSNGNVVYGFNPGKTYRVTIPRSPNTCITSASGDPNVVDFSTTFLVENKVVDAVPGKPQIKNKALIAPVDLVNAPHDTDVVFTYLDIMNVATLVNTTTGASQSMSVRVDLDGDTSTPNDQLIVDGTWAVSFDTAAQETTCAFHLAPGTELPGPGPSGSRRVVVLLNAAVIKDLGGNTLATGIDPVDGEENPTFFTFKTLDTPCPPASDLVIDFNDNVQEDAANSGLNMWNPASQPGLLIAGFGGGKGTHGEFIGSISTDFNAVGALATDGSSLPSTAISSNVAIPGRIPYVVKDIDSLTGSSLTIEDGVFQFSQFVIPNGITVRFEGDKAARIYVRGNVQIDGTLDVGGLPGNLNSNQNELKAFAGLNTPCQGPTGGATSWDDATGEPCPVFPQYLFGKPGGRGGPNGGDGGRGGDLPLNTPAYPPDKALLFQGFNGLTGTTPSVPVGATDASATPGTGTLAVPVNLFNGVKEVFGSIQDPGVGGGFTWDNCTSSGCFNPNPTLADGIVFFTTGVPAGPNSYTMHIGAPAGGGASFASTGASGTWCNENAINATCNNKLPAFPFASLITPLTPPAKTDAIPYYPLPPIGVKGASSLLVEPPDFGGNGLGEFSMLRGAAGGGGGGANAFGIASNVNPVLPITWGSNGSVAGLVSIGAAGGGGGGVLQLQSGGNFAVTKVSGIDATGGDGGDHVDRPNCTPTPQCGLIFAGQLYGQGMCPGGAGGGGSVMLQSAGTFTMANGSVNVRGGNGGDGRLLEIAFNNKFLLTAGTYPGYSPAVRLRLRGGDGGVGRWHYQGTSGQNIDTAFEPTQASNTSSVFSGVNIPAADFSGAQSKWMVVPASGAFIDVSGYTLTVQTSSGPQAFEQNDIDKNEVLDNTFANGGTLPVQIFFQGTRADAFNSPDPSQRTRWTQKVTELSSSSPKFIRFIIIYSRQASIANPGFIGVDALALKVSGC